MFRKWEVQTRMTKAVWSPWSAETFHPHFFTHSSAERHIRWLKKHLATFDAVLGTQYRIVDRTE